MRSLGALPPQLVGRLSFYPAALIGIASLAAVYVLDPTKNALTGTCPLLDTTGLFCPGCGATRAAYSLMHGDFVAALSYNLAFVVLLPFIALVAFRWGRYALKPERYAFVLNPSVLFAWTLLGSVVGFMVVRNLPITTLQWLAP